MRITYACLVSIVVIALSATLSVAQVNWMNPLHEPGISLEFSKLSFEDNPISSFWSIQYSLAARLKLANRWSLLLEVPYSHYRRNGFSYYGGYYPGRGESSIGNPYVGIEYGGQQSTPVVKFGVRPPLVGEENYYALEFGTLAAVDRWEAFWPKLFTLQLASGFRAVAKNQYRAQLLFGPTVMIPDEGDAELFTDFSTEFWYTGRYARAGIGLFGRYLLTESGYSFDERTQFQAGATVSVTMKNFHPGFHLRVPLDESIQHEINFTYGLNITIDFSEPGSTGSED